MTEPIPSDTFGQPAEDIGHSLPEAMWDELPHDVIEAEEPDPAMVAYARSLIDGVQP